MTYRADIDGVRAIAVVAVVAYHAGITGFGGGFVGVDVFFVISGYLITSLILEEKAKGAFSLWSFYQRRIRRILPALLVVVAATLAVGCLVLLPADLTGLAKSAVATVFFVSNVYFWRDGGYFGGDNELKPLLHTWSLAVEEQYYVLFPLLLIILLSPRLGRRLRIGLLIAAAAGSLVLSVACVAADRGLLAFFLFPTRAWELLAGVLLAWGVLPPVTRVHLRTGLAALGCGLILFAVVAYTKQTPFPGLAALPPCLGAGLLVYAGRDGGHGLTPVLASRPLVELGLVSYSLYLWHWPVLALGRYFAIQPLSALQTAGALVLSLVLAFLSHRLVERPFRQRTLAFAKVAAAMTLLGVGTAAAAVVVITNAGLPARFSPEVTRLTGGTSANYHCGRANSVPFGGYIACPVGLASRNPDDATVIIWGDSHAEAYVPGLAPALSALGERGLLVPVYGCPPFAERSVNPECLRFNRANFDRITRLKARTVILAMSWELYRNALFYTAGPRITGWNIHAMIDGQDRDDPFYEDGPHIPGGDFTALDDGLTATVDGLLRSGKQVVIIGPLPTADYPVAPVLARELAYGRRPERALGIDRKSFEARFTKVFQTLDHLAARPGVTVIYPHLLMCDATQCPFLQDGRPVYGDSNHLTGTFAQRLEPSFVSGLRGAVGRH